MVYRGVDGDTKVKEEPFYKWTYGKFIKVGTIKTEKNDSKRNIQTSKQSLLTKS